MPYKLIELVSDTHQISLPQKLTRDNTSSAFKPAGDDAAYLLPPAPSSNSNSNSNSVSISNSNSNSSSNSNSNSNSDSGNDYNSNYSSNKSIQPPIPPPIDEATTFSKKNKVEVEDSSSNSNSSSAASSRTTSSSSSTLVPYQYRMQQENFDPQTYTTGVMDVDQKDLKDVLYVADYVSDLFQHLHAAEGEQCPSTYMQNQTDINAKVSSLFIFATVA